jgi:hypothetical protein
LRTKKYRGLQEVARVEMGRPAASTSEARALTVTYLYVREYSIKLLLGYHGAEI